jgi:hypothetical protein
MYLITAHISVQISMRTILVHFTNFKGLIAAFEILRIELENGTNVEDKSNICLFYLLFRHWL